MYAKKRTKRYLQKYKENYRSTNAEETLDELKEIGAIRV